MQLILPDIVDAGRGMSATIYATGLALGALLWLLGWWGHRFWIVLFTTVVAGIVGLSSGRAAGVQPFVAGVLLAITAGLLALALARMFAFAAGGVAAWVLARAIAPAMEEPLLTFLVGGLLALLLFRLWTMALTSLAGTLLMVYCGLGLADHLGKLDALVWAEHRAMLLNSVVLGVALTGWVAQFVLDRFRIARERDWRNQQKLELAQKELRQRYQRKPSRWWPWGEKTPPRRAA